MYIHIHICTIVIKQAVAGGWIPFHDTFSCFFPVNNCDEVPSGGEDFEAVHEER